MALIICIECGKEFSDRANACPNCGCPTQVILEELAAKETSAEQKKAPKEQEKTTSEKATPKGKNPSTENPSQKSKKVPAEKVVGKYSILGRDFVVTEQLDKGLHMAKLIRDVGHIVSPMVEKDYRELGSIDKVLEKMPDQLTDLIDQQLDVAVKGLIDAGIYEYTKESFYEKYQQDFDTSGVFQPVIDQYLEILDMEEKVSEYHDYIAQLRKNAWSGGGFGIGGAIKGHIKAQMLNYGNLLLHAIPDGNRRSQDETRIRQLKIKLYNAPETLEQITNGYCDVIRNIMIAVLEESEAAGIITIPDLDASKAVSYVNSALEAKNISGEQRIDILRRAFEIDPLNKNVILAILMSGYDENGDVERFAKAYDLYDAYLAQKQEILEERYADDVKELKENEHNHSNEAFCRKIELCSNLALAGLNVKDYVTTAVKGRAWRNISDEDVYILTDILCENGLFLGQDLVEWSVTRILDAVRKQDASAS